MDAALPAVQKLIAATSASPKRNRAPRSGKKLAAIFESEEKAIQQITSSQPVKELRTFPEIGS
ncbi:hypothetical protein TWF718_005487 [Orbilia javanica]|uniref:Uncharacterized protein n=1 Tax=Orbilia javanica TaxID=47235 RepID=A0AAN8RJF4_9PEZI